LFHEEEEEVVGVVVGMEYLVSLADVGMQVFLCFQDDDDDDDDDGDDDDDEEEEEEEGNHLRKEHVPYYVNYKESVP
jgi:hypothetical protein